MWYQTIPLCMGIVGILSLSFGVWAILQWDQYSKLLSNIKVIIEKVRL